jgi:hypothetical protein
VLRLFADDRKLDVVEQELEPTSGKGVLRAYPILRSHRELRIEVGGKGRDRSGPAKILVALPS